MDFSGKIWHFIQADGPLLMPVVLGFVAVYWLLPRARRDWLVPGAVAGAAAIVCAGWYLVHREFVLIEEQALFYAFSGIAILGGGLMLAQHNPVRAALSFALVVLSTCGLFLLLAAPFLMAATIIVYAGAIIITFLFVVMLAQQAGITSADQRSREPFLSCLAGFVLLASLLVVLHRNYDTREIDLMLDNSRANNPVLRTLQEVKDATTPEEILRILGEPKKNDDRLPLLAKMKQDDPLRTRIEDELENEWSKWGYDRYDRLTIMENVQKKCKSILTDVDTKLIPELKQAKVAYGSLQPAASLPLSSHSGVPANEPFSTETKERLPARNVEALGRSLFTDYLVAVEVAGVLLLVATIGAIVIAGRRTGEELR